MFEELDYTEVFDAVWACSSLLHIPKEKLLGILLKINNALKTNGIFYASFKYGDFSGERNGRFFTDFTEQSFNKIIESSKCFNIISTAISFDARPDRSAEKWYNAIMRKNK
jgi:flavodoxin